MIPLFFPNINSQERLQFFSFFPPLVRTLVSVTDALQIYFQFIFAKLYDSELNYNIFKWIFILSKFNTCYSKAT